MKAKIWEFLHQFPPLQAPGTHQTVQTWISLLCAILHTDTPLLITRCDCNSEECHCLLPVQAAGAHAAV